MTESYNAAVLDADACLDWLKQARSLVHLNLMPAASAEELLNSVITNEPDVVLLDMKMPGTSGWDLAKRLRKISPNTPVFLLSANPDWSILEGDPLIEMVRSPFDPNEVLLRIFRLLHGLSQENTNTYRQYRLPNLVVDELRSENGRIDAKEVAQMFNLSIPALARIIKTGEQALYKTSDAHSIQSKLLSFERIAWGLLKLGGSVKGLRTWLNAPNPELDNDLPIDYIKDGHVEDVAAMVEDALLGQPS